MSGNGDSDIITQKLFDILIVDPAGDNAFTPCLRAISITKKGTKLPSY
jgi:hypothetical protein